MVVCAYLLCVRPVLKAYMNVRGTPKMRARRGGICGKGDGVEEWSDA